MKQKKRNLGSIMLLLILISKNTMAQSLYFSSPQESVKTITELLIEENWEKLPRYYYLENATEETIDSLSNGSYFIRTEKPEVAHPSGSWKYKKPFAPSFKYLNHISLENENVKVNVSKEIDQGNGMVQQGISSFYLIKLKEGYQLLL